MDAQRVHLMLRQGFHHFPQRIHGEHPPANVNGKSAHRIARIIPECAAGRFFPIQKLRQRPKPPDHPLTFCSVQPDALLPDGAQAAFLSKPLPIFCNSQIDIPFFHLFHGTIDQLHRLSDKFLYVLAGFLQSLSGRFFPVRFRHKPYARFKPIASAPACPFRQRHGKGRTHVSFRSGSLLSFLHPILIHIPLFPDGLRFFREYLFQRQSRHRHSVGRRLFLDLSV